MNQLKVKNSKLKIGEATALMQVAARVSAIADGMGEVVPPDPNSPEVKAYLREKIAPRMAEGDTMETAFLKEVINGELDTAKSMVEIEDLGMAELAIEQATTMIGTLRENLAEAAGEKPEQPVVELSTEANEGNEA